MVHRNLALLIPLAIIASSASAATQNDALQLELRTQVKQGDPGSHFTGLDKIIGHVERYWCPTMTSDSITGSSPFVFDANTPAR